MTVPEEWDAIAVYVNRKRSGRIAVTVTVTLDGTINKMSQNRSGDDSAYDVLEDSTHVVLELMRSMLKPSPTDEF